MDWSFYLTNFSTLFFDFSFWNESWVLQFFIVYTLYNIYTNSNLFYVVFYVFFQIILFGIFLSFYQMELFTAFLWLAETVIIFISLLMLFYLNVYGNVSTLNKTYISLQHFCLFMFLGVFLYYYYFPLELELFLPFEISSISLWDDYYESLWNNILTDLYGLYLSYYYLNSYEFLFLGLILLIGSVVCVNLNKHVRLLRVNSYYDFFTIFDFFKDFTKFIFMRKQNLNDQTLHSSATRIFKKKVIINFIKGNHC